MLGIFTFIITVCGTPELTTDQPADVEQIVGTLERLNSLSFTVEIRREDPQGIVGRPARRTPLEVRVLTVDSGRFRVDAFEDNRAVARVINDGNRISEWDAKENLWTTYTLPKAYTPSDLLLVTDFDIARYLESWVGQSTVYGAKLRNVLTRTDLAWTKSEKLEDQECDVATIKESHANPPNPGVVTETYALFFDRKTRLPVKEEQTIEVNVLSQSLKSSTTRQYRDVKINPPVSDDAFAFAAPEGSTFVAPDAPRFQKLALDGKPAPKTTLSSLTGESVTLADYKEKNAVLLAFWATWCAPCKLELPILAKLHNEYAGKGLAVLGVSVDDHGEAVRRYIKEHPVPYAILHDPKQQAANQFGVRGLPHTVLIDKTGTIVKTWRGGGDPERQEKEFRKALAELGIGQ